MKQNNQKELYEDVGHLILSTNEITWSLNQVNDVTPCDDINIIFQLNDTWPQTASSNTSLNNLKPPITTFNYNEAICPPNLLDANIENPIKMEISVITGSASHRDRGPNFLVSKSPKLLGRILNINKSGHISPSPEKLLMPDLPEISEITDTGINSQTGEGEYHITDSSEHFNVSTDDPT